MARCPILPDELWERISSFIEGPLDLFAFYQINAMTRSILSNPNHKIWSNLLSKTDYRGKYYYETLPDFPSHQTPNRAFLRAVTSPTCMLCDSTMNLGFHYYLKRKLCICCLHQNIIVDKTIERFFPKANLDNVPKSMLFVLPNIELVLNGDLSQFHYWKRDFLDINAALEKTFCKNGREWTFAEFDAERQMAIDVIRSRGYACDEDGCFDESVQRSLQAKLFASRNMKRKRLVRY